MGTMTQIGLRHLIVKHKYTNYSSCILFENQLNKLGQRRCFLSVIWRHGIQPKKHRLFTMFDLMRYPYLTFSFNLGWQGPPGDQGNRGPTGRPGKPVTNNRFIPRLTHASSSALSYAQEAPSFLLLSLLTFQVDHNSIIHGYKHDSIVLKRCNRNGQTKLTLKVKNDHRS